MEVFVTFLFLGCLLIYCILSLFGEMLGQFFGQQLMRAGLAEEEDEYLDEDDYDPAA
jgi:hypothetical protein